VSDEVLAKYEAAFASLSTEAEALSSRLREVSSEKRVLHRLIVARKIILGLTTSDKLAKPQRRTLKNFGQKSLFVRKLLRDRPGLTGPEIRRASEDEFDLPSNFPYSLLGSWKQAGRAYQDPETGGYFLSEDGDE
jgi:hypothetical protein